MNNKVFSTSIIPTGKGSMMEPIRDAKIVAPLAAIEIVHVMIFITIITVLFGGTWKMASRLAGQVKKPAPLRKQVKGHKARGIGQAARI